MDYLKVIWASLKKNVWPIVRGAAIAAAITFLTGLIADLEALKDG